MENEPSSSVEDERARIQQHIDSLCEGLDTIYVNLFDENSRQHIEKQPIHKGCIIPLGTYALGVWEHGEDVHLIYLGNTSSKTFWALVHHRLELPEDLKMTEQRRTGVMELSSAEIAREAGWFGWVLRDFADASRYEDTRCRFYLHYCALPSDSLSRGLGTLNLPFARTKVQDPCMESNTNRVYDIQGLAHSQKARSVENAKRFLDAYHMLHGWASSNGLVGSKLGFLDPGDLIWLADKSFKRQNATKTLESENMDLAKMQSELFAMLKEDLLSCCRGETAKATMITKGPAPVPVEPVDEIQHHLTVEAKTIIQQVIARSDTAPSQGQVHQTGRSPEFEQFLTSYSHFLQIDYESWSERFDYRAIFQDQEAPKDLKNAVAAFYTQQIPNVSNTGVHSLRIWPVPVVHTDDNREQAFIVGVWCDKSIDTPGLETIFSHFQNYLEKEVFQYDCTIGAVSFKVLAAADLPATWERPDHKDPTYFADQEEILYRPHLSTDVIGPGPYKRRSAPTPSPEPKLSKFRDARSAISRLRHDPAYSQTQFEVGYVDRFKDDLLWLSLEKWGNRETEDEDFIPEHRVRALRRLDTKAVVWDRVKRIDLL